jgi:hypothetical protein
VAGLSSASGGSERAAGRPRQRVPAGLQVIESCNSTWLFDTRNKRFRRVPRGMAVDLPAAGDWERYVKLEIDLESDAFLVTLNESGTRLLRSFRHTEPCEQCGAAAGTQQLSLEAISRGA